MISCPAELPSSDQIRSDQMKWLDGRNGVTSTRLQDIEARKSSAVLVEFEIPSRPSPSVFGSRTRSSCGGGRDGNNATVMLRVQSIDPSLEQFIHGAS